MTNRLSLVGLLAVSAVGCYHQVPVGQAHVAELGAHVLSTPGATSIAWSDGHTIRVCTLPSSGPGRTPYKRWHRKAGPAQGGPAGHRSGIDAFLFRLCEARGNGDITAEQYNAALGELQELMRKAHAGMGPRGGMPGAMPGPDEWGRPGGPRRKGMGPGKGMGPRKGKGPRGPGPGPDGPAETPPAAPPTQ